LTSRWPLCAKIAVPEAAQAIQYDPQPPFDADSPAKAPAGVYEAVSALYAAAEANSAR
jgi:hypothetical protein